jgi:hypothetical protein
VSQLCLPDLTACSSHNALNQLLLPPLPPLLPLLLLLLLLLQAHVGWMDRRAGATSSDELSECGTGEQLRLNLINLTLTTSNTSVSLIHSWFCCHSAATW